ncbi:MAG: hypothetical protein ACRD6I_16050, partial [Candidatus Acidiferrales bacterium]
CYTALFTISFANLPASCGSHPIISFNYNTYRSKDFKLLSFQHLEKTGVTPLAPVIASLLDLQPSAFDVQLSSTQENRHAHDA